MARRGTGYLLAGLIVLALVVVLHVVCLSCCLWARGWSIPRGLIVLLASTLVAPATFLGADYCRRRPWWGRHLEAILLGVGVLGVLWTAGVVVLSAQVWSFGIVLTNPARYEEVRGSVGPNSHFPKRIPAHARGVRFSYWPGPLQASSHLQLRMQLPPDEIAAIVARARQQGVMEYRGGEQAPDGSPTTGFFTKDGARGLRHPDHVPFPSSYLILQFGEPTEREPGAWNHGAIGGIAVDKDAGEVVYWAEAW